MVEAGWRSTCAQSVSCSKAERKPRNARLVRNVFGKLMTTQTIRTLQHTAVLSLRAMLCASARRRFRATHSSAYGANLDALDTPATEAKRRGSVN
jgi:hypothetical protein